MLCRFNNNNNNNNDNYNNFRKTCSDLNKFGFFFIYTKILFNIKFKKSNELF
jgi:hypothetical protein